MELSDSRRAPTSAPIIPFKAKKPVLKTTKMQWACPPSEETISNTPEKSTPKRNQQFALSIGEKSNLSRSDVVEKSDLSAEDFQCKVSGELKKCDADKQTKNLEKSIKLLDKQKKNLDKPIKLPESFCLRGILQYKDPIRTVLAYSRDKHWSGVNDSGKGDDGDVMVGRWQVGGCCEGHGGYKGAGRRSRKLVVEVVIAIKEVVRVVVVVAIEMVELDMVLVGNSRGDDIPEGALPQLFYPPKQDLRLSMDKTSKVSAVSHIPPSFRRLFSHKVSSLELENATNIKESPTYCPRETRVYDPSPARLPASRVPETPSKEIASCETEGSCSTETTKIHGTPASLICTPARLMAATPSLQPEKRCYMSPIDDTSAMPNKLLRRPARISLNFDSP
ncbi:hypothetical protein Ancab_020226 [Ancistrocladus abbreviatus]